MTGLVVLSDAETGMVEALLDAGAVTALRTGAAAVLAAETLGRPGGSAAVIGAGVNGRAAARCFAALGRAVSLWDVDGERAARVAAELGVGVAPSREDGARARTSSSPSRPAARSCSATGSLRPGQHVSLMGADGPGKAEIAVAEIARSHVFCDDWEQASHGGELAAAVDGGRDRARAT